MKRIAFISQRTARVVEAPDITEPLKPLDVRGRTLFTLTSPGTELSWAFLGLVNPTYPVYPGYASIFEVEAVGADVKDLTPGTIVMSSGSHCSMQQATRAKVVSLPAGLNPEIAAFARLAGVSMSTLNTTTARPPSRVLITGLGPVGNLAAQIFASCGYQVTAVDPVESRRKAARAIGLDDVRDSVANGPVDLTDKVALHVECSGHEQAVLDGARVVRKRGEIVLLATPWKRKTEIYAHELHHAIFHRYLVVRSGWEWEVPLQPTDFSNNSIIENYQAALKWLADGRLRVDGLASLYKPDQAQEVYDGLLEQSLPTIAAVFDWQ